MVLGTLWRRVRRNHALEHATIAVLGEHGVRTVAAGNSTPGGFFIYGSVDKEELVRAVTEALDRMRKGERKLAISPFCGTNLVVAALTVGVASVIAQRQNPGWRGLSSVVSASLLGLLVARPLGALVQRYVTTSSDVDVLDVRRIRTLGVGPGPVHRVSTRQG